MTFRILSTVVLVIFAGATISSCASSQPPRDESSSLSAAPTSRDATPAVPTATAGPIPDCSLPTDSGLRCGVEYTSVAGTGNMSWTGQEPIHFRIDQTPESLIAALTTPCNPVSAPARVSGGYMNIDSSKASTGAKGCDGPRSEKEKAASDFLLAGATYTVTGDRILLTNSLGSVELQKA